MTDFYSVQEDLVDFLRGTISPPHTGTGNWIYVDYPRTDATFPRISVTHTGGGLKDAYIGDWDGSTFVMKSSLTFDIDVWVGLTNRATYATVIYTGTSLRDYLTNKVVNALQENREYLRSSYNFQDVEITNIITQPLDEENNIHQKTISITITFDWTKAGR